MGPIAEERVINEAVSSHYVWNVGGIGIFARSTRQQIYCGAQVSIRIIRCETSKFLEKIHTWVDFVSVLLCIGNEIL